MRRQVRRPNPPPIIERQFSLSSNPVLFPFPLLLPSKEAKKNTHVMPAAFQANTMLGEFVVGWFVLTGGLTKTGGCAVLRYLLACCARFSVNAPQPTLKTGPTLANRDPRSSAAEAPCHVMPLLFYLGLFGTAPQAQTESDKPKLPSMP